MPFSHSTLRLLDVDWHVMDDIQFLVDLRNQHREFFFDSNPVTFEQTLRWVRQFSPVRRLFILWFNGQRVGTIGYRQLDVGEYRLRWLENLAILPEFQGLGLAKWMLEQMQEPGMFVLAQVFSSNRKVLRLYKEMGFMRVNPRTIKKCERRGHEKDSVIADQR